MTASVPDEIVSLEADGEWAAWSGVAVWPGTEGAAGQGGGGPVSVALVSIAVAPLRLVSGAAAGEALRAALRERHPTGAAVIDEFATAGGHPALRVRDVVTQPVNGHPVTTGQAQVLVVFPGAGALGVVSGLCPDPADLDRATALVSEIAAQLSVTASQAAA